jgi:hypothetical protein
MHRLISPARHATPLACLALLLIFSSLSKADNPRALPQDVVAETTRQIVEGRELVKGYVADIKEKYKPTSPEYREARKRYRLAVSKYNAWAASVKRAIRRGKTKDLQNDAAYKAAATGASAAAKSFVDYVESTTGGSKGGFSILGGLIDAGIKVWTAVKDRKALERQNDAIAFYDDVKWDQWEAISGTAQEDTSKGLSGPIEEIQMGDPPVGGAKGIGETLTIDVETAQLIDTSLAGESKGARIDNKTLAMETLNLSKEYAGMKVSRAEPPSPTKVKAFLALYGLPFRYGHGPFVPYCAAGVGFSAARAHRRLAWPKDHPTDPGHADVEDSLALRESLPDVTRDFTYTHPSTIIMMNAAKARKYPNGQSYWVPRGQRPQQGWLVFFNWTHGRNPQHVAIVDSINGAGTRLNTVEFNTSRDNPSNGGKVVAKTRPVGYVVGYIRTYQ